MYNESRKSKKVIEAKIESTRADAKADLKELIKMASATLEILEADTAAYSYNVRDYQRSISHCCSDLVTVFVPLCGLTAR